MSHFPVLVIGEDPVKLLAPYHEFECTGEDDEYIQDIDETEEYREVYEEDTTTMVQSPKGERTVWDYSEIPEGSEKIEVPTKELKTFTQYVLAQVAYEHGAPHTLRPGEERTEDHKFHFIELDEKDEVVRVVKRTNPNSHWDGWVLGGRWGRFFKLKAGVEFDIDNVGGGSMYTAEHYLHDGLPGAEEYVSHPSTVENRRRWVAELTAKHSVDHARVKDIDFEAGRDHAEEGARMLFAKWQAIYERHGKPLPFEHFLELQDVAVNKLKEQGIEAEQVTSLYGHIKYKVSREAQERERAQQSYNAQPAIKAESQERLIGLRSTPVEEFGYDEEVYVAKMRDKAMTPYAVVKDGKWFAKGKMGMFAHSEDNMTEEEWVKQVHKLYEELPEDALLTLVDCHV